MQIFIRQAAPVAGQKPEDEEISLKEAIFDLDSLSEAEQSLLDSLWLQLFFKVFTDPPDIWLTVTCEWTERPVFRLYSLVPQNCEFLGFGGTQVSLGKV